MSETQRESRSGFVAWMTMAVLAAAPSWAPRAGAAAEVSTEIPELSAEIGATVVDGTLALSLEQAIEIALQRNLGLIVQRYNDVESRLDLDQSFGIYDLLGTAQMPGQVWCRSCGRKPRGGSQRCGQPRAGLEVR